MIFVKLREEIENYNQRTGQKLTYKDLAEITGISQAAIEAIGSRPDYNPTLSTIDALCKALQCDVSDLLEYKI